ncbi:hypothetical protein Ae505Ps2_6220c [Pseudonocardia sp. Ae505_Ps2]|nr:hypothetical protein Ae505Ps2_6220c [Pseudonocardia sp. Ae505_Ps2]
MDMGGTNADLAYAAQAEPMRVEVVTTQRRRSA